MPCDCKHCDNEGFWIDVYQYGYIKGLSKNYGRIFDLIDLARTIINTEEIYSADF